MLKLKFIFSFCFIIPLCTSVPLFEKLSKCNLKDNDCHIKVIESVISELAESGSPTYRIPKIDPYLLKHFEMNALGMLHIVVEDGSLEGLKSCKLNEFDLKTDTKLIAVDITCARLKIAGSYNVKTLPTFELLAGGIKIHGDGTGNVELDTLHLNFVVPFEFKKAADGQIHFHIKAGDAKHTFEIVDNAVFAGNNLFIGSVDISQVGIAVLNENWKFVTKSLGQAFVNPLLDLILQLVSNVLDSVPVKELIADDVSQYL